MIFLITNLKYVKSMFHWEDISETLCTRPKTKTKNIVVLPFSHMKSVLVPFESRGREAEYI